MTLGELRKLTENLSDDIKIISKDNSYELQGNMTELNGIKVVKVKKEKRNFKDDFDGTFYSEEVYVFDKNGDEMLYV